MSPRARRWQHAEGDVRAPGAPGAFEEHRLGRTRSRSWIDLRRLQVGPGAVLVSPFAQPRWLDRYRGILLYLDGADREAVLAIVRERVGKS